MVTKEIEVEQLKVGRHASFQTSCGRLDVHASDTVVGVWLKSGNESNGRDENLLTAYVLPNRSPVLALWPPAKYWGPLAPGRNRLPFGFSGEGLQVPHQDGTVTILPLEKLSELVRALGK